MKVLMINGIRTDPDLKWETFAAAFKRWLPEATFHVETEPWCKLREVGRFRAFTKRLIEKYDDGEDLLIVGHSLGGVIACAMQPRLNKSKVLGITTIHSPHRFIFSICTHLFRASDVSAPVLSFQGLHDMLVWWGTRHPKAVLHVRNNANHFIDLRDFEENAELVAETTVRAFFKDSAGAE